MSLPSFEPLPDNPSGTGANARRRRRPVAIPPGASDRGKFIHDLSLRTVPTFDYFLFSLLAGLVLGAALLLNSPALFVLAALIAPFMAPAVGIALGTIAGSIPFILRSLGSLAVGSLIIFVCGAIAGWAASILPAGNYDQAALHAVFTWPGLLVLALGAGLSAYSILRLPNQKPLVSSVAIAYGLYLPAGAAGFGLTSAVPELWPNGLYVFLIHLAWTALVGTLVLGLRGLRPLSPTGYLLGGIYGVGSVVLVAMALVSPPTLPTALMPRASGTDGPERKYVVLEPSPTPSETPTTAPSLTPVPPTTTITPTRTLLPTLTATLTITPKPTPVWARINASEGGGALIREEPNYNAPVVQSILNGTLVEVLPEVKENGGAAWVHIQLVDGRTGWVVRDLLRTATPAPGW